jgi:hypothetical protein
LPQLIIQSVFAMDACVAAVENLASAWSSAQDWWSPLAATFLALTGLQQLDEFTTRLCDAPENRLVQLLQSGLSPVTFSVPPLLLLALAVVVLQVVRRLAPVKQHEKVYVLDFSVHQPEKRCVGTDGGHYLVAMLGLRNTEQFFSWLGAYVMASEGL